MIRFQLAYRFQDNSVMGFVEGSFTEDSAKGGTIKQAQKACDVRGETFDETRLILKKNGLTKEEMAKIKEDWSIGRGQGIMATRRDLIKNARRLRQGK